MNKQEIYKFRNQLTILAEQALVIYEPQVNSIIANKVRDNNYIECTFDEMLFLYKKLARYYFTVNPQGTAYYRESY